MKKNPVSEILTNIKLGGNSHAMGNMFVLGLTYFVLEIVGVSGILPMLTHDPNYTDIGEKIFSSHIVRI